VTSSFADDTELDAIAAQVRSSSPLTDAELTSLLHEARRSPAGPAGASLVEHQLATVLDSALARRGRGVDVIDLYQEGTLAAAVAIGEYAGREGTAAGLERYVARLVGVFLDDVIKREAEQKLADTLLVEQVKLLEAAELALRRRLEREPTALELAAALEWTPEVVEVVGAVLHRARDLYDSEIVDYLDDVDESDAGDTPDI
jgi:DNA-directed RNA polymerase sigma subunit (sigma70/sigma32)